MILSKYQPMEQNINISVMKKLVSWGRNQQFLYEKMGLFGSMVIVKKLLILGMKT
ncbi:MAG: hypothetical protein O4861_12245 [Trichodesmium sp. St16_bin4-tuft]|nr:hypothetical protein [Trichodesmium sp. MAG_R01]MDE5070243.1 hypothetical protein [Trichodesmium sp. St4_bin8_1]MDE5071090.1 hypothetical protein [Trichodesmium sp. St5_bin8]MDE5091308.1 hypothetical protein [Trichodesmium sp. St18_bin3_1_1]MDE5099059.1 hypothetical protein [Trichodesmium sp. St16_bin4-tuft]MDE5102850.1 hypothetical protein [Trichodesmium sp. St19_bin2]